MTSPNDSLILVINPGSTSTKVALFSASKKILEKNLSYDTDIISSFLSIWDQFDYRLETIQEFLQKNSIPYTKLTAVVGRGGLLKQLKRGTYLIDEALIKDSKIGIQGEHISNLGCALAYEIAQKAGCNAYTVDPVSVNEFEPIAYYSGHPLIERRALSHSLNIRAAAIWAAEKLGLEIDNSQFVVAHLGGGISIAPVKNGRIIDVNDASSDGPFAPDRTGGLPLQPFIDLCYSGKYSKQEIKRLVMGSGGMAAYLGSNDLREVEKRIDNGDEKAKNVVDAMAYQISKEIAAMASVLYGHVQAIVITGGLAFSQRFLNLIGERVTFIAQIMVFPGEMEMEAMAAGVSRVMKGQEKLQSYS